MDKEIRHLGIDEELLNKIAKYLVSFWKYLNVQKYCDIDKAKKYFIEDEKGKVEFLDKIERNLVLSKTRVKLLDVGCGKGGIAIACSLRGGEAFGIDPNKDELKIAMARAHTIGVDNVRFVCAVGENLPFKNGYFDLVLASSVLEHVKNPEAVIKEMIRVMNDEGFICVTVPNSLFPREAHYKVFYIPYLPKRLGKIYLRLRNLNPDYFIRRVNYPYISASRIIKIFRQNGMTTENITEREVWKRFENPELISSFRIRKLLNILKKLKLNRFVAKIVISLNLYPSFCIVARKHYLTNIYKK